MEYAGLWLRFGAIIIDAIVILIIDEFVSKAVFFLNIDDRGITSVVIMCFYFILFEASSTQGTIGKKIYGLKVVDYDCNKLRVSHALWRNFAKIISVATIGIGFVISGITSKKQALHDYISKTLVIKTGKTNYLYIIIVYIVGGLVLR